MRSDRVGRHRRHQAALSLHQPVYHTGIVFAPGGMPAASLPAPRRVAAAGEQGARIPGCQRRVPADRPRALFDECGGFDEAYLQRLRGHRPVPAGAAARPEGRLLHQRLHLSLRPDLRGPDGRRRPERGALREQWADRVRIDRDEYLARDRRRWRAGANGAGVPVTRCADDCIYLADDLGQGSALTWVNVELALALQDRGVPVFINGSRRCRRPSTRRPAGAGAARCDGTAGRRRADQVVPLLAAASEPRARRRRQPGVLRHQLSVRPAGQRALGLLAAVRPRRTATTSCR